MKCAEVTLALNKRKKEEIVEHRKQDDMIYGFNRILPSNLFFDADDYDFYDCPLYLKSRFTSKVGSHKNHEKSASKENQSRVQKSYQIMNNPVILFPDQ